MFPIIIIIINAADSYETSSRRKQPDRSKRSHLRRSPTSSRHGHRQRHRDERSHSTSRRRHRERPAKDRTTPVKVKPTQYSVLRCSVWVFLISYFYSAVICSIFLFDCDNASLPLCFCFVCVQWFFFLRIRWQQPVVEKELSHHNGRLRKMNKAMNKLEVLFFWPAAFACW